jgi:predicted nucleic acid-binding protein
MTLLVVDASVVVKWFVPEIHADAALRLLDREKRFLAPDHLFAETTNAIRKRVRQREFSVEYGYEIIRQIGMTGIAIDLVSCRDLMADAYKIAVTYGRSVYDALYLALAMQRKTLSLR